MENTYSPHVTGNRSIYQFLLTEGACIRSRAQCDKNCSTCKLSVNTAVAERYIQSLIGIIKSRSPELYFLDDLAQLQKILESRGTKNEPSE